MSALVATAALAFQIARLDFFGTMFRGDLPMPMVSAADVGDRAVRLLTDEAATLTRVHELHGGGDYTMAQATAILGAAIGKPKVQYVQVPHQDALASMLGAGMSPSFAEAVLETARSFKEQEGWALAARSPRAPTPSRPTSAIPYACSSVSAARTSPAAST